MLSRSPSPCPRRQRPPRGADSGRSTQVNTCSRRRGLGPRGEMLVLARVRSALGRGPRRLLRRPVRLVTSLCHSRHWEAWLLPVEAQEAVGARPRWPRRPRGQLGTPGPLFLREQRGRSPRPPRTRSRSGQRGRGAALGPGDGWEEPVAQVPPTLHTVRSRRSTRLRFLRGHFFSPLRVSSVRAPGSQRRAGLPLRRPRVRPPRGQSLVLDPGTRPRAARLALPRTRAPGAPCRPCFRASGHDLSGDSR